MGGGWAHPFMPEVILIACKCRYVATVVGVSALGKLTPLGNDIPFTMPELGAATLLAAEAAGPTSGTLSASPPSAGGPWRSFAFSAVPRGGGAPIAVSCPTPSCSISGLSPSSVYDVTVVVISEQTGKATPASNALPIATAPLG